jgi:hypothetical protein
MRRDFALSEGDQRFLERLGLPWETVLGASPAQRWVLIHDHPVPAGYNHDRVIVAIQILPGYPDGPLDMVFVFPPLARQDGRPINATQCSEAIDGNQYQRWSRHLTGSNPWRPGEDNLETYHDLVCDWFRREFERVAA